VGRVVIGLILDRFPAVVGAVEPAAAAGGGEEASGPPRLQPPLACGFAGQGRRTGVSSGCARRNGRGWAAKIEWGEARWR
jgi:hypothetical protein